MVAGDATGNSSRLAYCPDVTSGARFLLESAVRLGVSGLIVPDSIGLATMHARSRGSFLIYENTMHALSASSHVRHEISD